MPDEKMNIEKFLTDAGEMFGKKPEEMKAAWADFRNQLISDTVKASAGPAQPVDMDMLVIKIAPVVKKLINEHSQLIQLGLAVGAISDEYKAGIAELKAKLAASPGGTIDLQAIATAIAPNFSNMAADTANKYCEANFKTLQANVYKELQPVLDKIKLLQENAANVQPQPQFQQEGQ